jgi:spermidine/putrescine transport system ATP-binding protein
VAGFIGVSNLLPGTVEDGGVRLSTGQLVPAQVPQDCGAGASVYCSVRPEKIFLGDLEDDMVSVEGRSWSGSTSAPPPR